MWKTKGKKTYPTIAVRSYNDTLLANIPQAVLRHLGVDSSSQLVFKLQPNKTVSVKLLKIEADKLVPFKPQRRRKQFPSLATFLSQR